LLYTLLPPDKLILTRIGRPADKRVFLPRFRVVRYAGAPAGGALPRAKYTKGPGPLPAMARVTFRFDNKARGELINLLPLQLQQLRAPNDIKQGLANARKFETLAELIVALTEEFIETYLTGCRLLVNARANPANVRAAIRKLRAALKPFVEGWVDDETATIIPGDLDRLLADRERGLARMRVPPTRRRNLAILCGSLGSILKQFSLANRVLLEERDAIRFVATALDWASIEHSYSTENPSRFAILVFPKS
jgi:hypothetical protein